MRAEINSAANARNSGRPRSNQVRPPITLTPSLSLFHRAMGFESIGFAPVAGYAAISTVWSVPMMHFRSALCVYVFESVYGDCWFVGVGWNMFWRWWLDEGSG